MTDLEKLLERMRRVEALFARTDVPGERDAAGHALNAILEQLQRYQDEDPAVEFRFSLSDAWSRRLFLALARRYKLEPYRLRGQRHTTVMLKVSKKFVDKTLWPEYRELADLLESHLNEVTNRIIEQSFNASASDDTVVRETSNGLPAPAPNIPDASRSTEKSTSGNLPPKTS